MAESVHKKLIMLVDDDPIFRRITSGYLSAQGYDVMEAENGLDGLRKLRTVEPDLVLCDLSMPVLDGIEFVEEVSLEYPSLPLIVVSATDEVRQFHSHQQRGWQSSHCSADGCSNQ